MPGRAATAAPAYICIYMHGRAATATPAYIHACLDGLVALGVEAHLEAGAPILEQSRRVADRRLVRRAHLVYVYVHAYVYPVRRAHLVHIMYM